MMSSTTATAPSSRPKKLFGGGYTNAPGNASPWQRGPTKNHKRQHPNKKVSKPKSGKPLHQSHRKRQNNGDRPKHNVPQHPLSLPPPGTLLERLGGSVEDEVPSTLTYSDRIDGGESVSEAMEEGVSFSSTPHFYTPEPDEVERFLESVIGAPPAAPSPSVHACSASKPSLALETRNLPVNHHLVKVEETPSSVLYSPTQTAVNSLPSADRTLDQTSLLGGAMSPPSASTIEECKKLLVPVLLASAQASGSGRHLDSEQCHGLLSDDHCTDFIRKAKEMRLQLSSLLSQETPVNQGWDGSLKRDDRVDGVGGWRDTHSRFNSVNTVVSDVSRRDSDTTLVDATGGRLRPKAPRAMLQNNFPESAQDGAPYETRLAASPTAEDASSAASLIELVYQAIKMSTAGQPVTETDPTRTEQITADPGHMPSPIQPAPPSSTGDFVAHLPTQPGSWFRRQGGRFAEIVCVDIEVSDEMFYLSREREPSRLRMDLRLCSVPVDAMMQVSSGDTPAALQDVVDGVIARRALQWPKKGTLVVQVNPESERSKTWLPHTLESDPLDVTSCMQPGKNVFRFIQLADLSEFTFVLVASPPPPEEAWRSWDWASLADSHRTQPSPSSTDELSEFAFIPVTVRA